MAIIKRTSKYFVWQNVTDMHYIHMMMLHFLLPPRMGRRIPLVYPMKKQVREHLSELGEIILQIGELSPEPNISLKKLGETFPHLGEALPYVGEALPYMGEEFPYVGEGLPYMGEEFPYLGEGFPYLGERVPYMGEGSPYMGERVPYVGEGKNKVENGGCRHENRI